MLKQRAFSFFFFVTTEKNATLYVQDIHFQICIFVKLYSRHEHTEKLKASGAFSFCVCD